MNDFYVAPGNNFMQGLNAIGEAIDSRAGLMRERAKEQQNIKDRQDALTTFKGNDPDKMAELAAKNPNAGKYIDELVQNKDEKTKQNMIETAKMIATEPDNTKAGEYLADRIQFLIDNKADPTGSMNLFKMLQQNPDQARTRAMMYLSAKDPNAYNALKAANAKPEVKLQNAGYGKMADQYGNIVDVPVKPETKKEDKIIPYGYGQMLNTTTNEIIKVPVKPNSNNASGASGLSDATNAEDIASAIVSGDMPPTMVSTIGRKQTALVAAALARKKYNLSGAVNDFKAVQTRIKSMNTATQQKLWQATDFANHSLGLVEDLASQWKAGGFPALNKARLYSAKQGLLGPEAQSLATRLENQISDLQSELATVYKGGNSSTDQGLQHASKQLRGEWSENTLRDNVGLIRKNLTLRTNSMKNIPTMGASSNNVYEPTQLKKEASKTDSSVIHETLPDASGFSGKIATDNDTGKKYKSDGKQWIEVK
jgi:hypothetical protein